MEAEESPTIKELRQQLEDMTDRLEGLGGNGKDKLFSMAKDNLETARKKAAFMKDKSQRFVEENPWHAAAMAALAGALVAALIMKKSQR